MGRASDAKHHKKYWAGSTTNNDLAPNINIAELRNPDLGSCLYLHINLFLNYADSLLK